jgi:hypothetical protein
MALSTEVQAHLDNVLDAVATEVGAMSDAQFIRDRVALNFADVVVESVRRAVAAENFGDVENPNAND